MGVNHTMVSRLATVSEVVTVTIRQCMPCGIACSRWFLGAKRKLPYGVAIPASTL